MNFLVEKDKITRILSKIQGLTGKNSNLALTEDILLDASGKGVLIKATDLETGFEGFCPAEIKKSGIVAINAKKFYEILKQFPDSDIRVEEIDKQKVRISNNNICYNIFGDNPEYFPEIAEVEGASFFKINAFVFREMIKKMTVISGTSSEKKSYINGVLLETKRYKNNFVLKMVSTDTNRLSIVSCGLEKIAGLEQKQEKIIIPKKGLNELAKFIDFDELLKVGIKDNILIVRKERETVVVRLLEGDFPEYNEIVSVESKRPIKLDRSAFSKTLKRMSILAGDHDSVMISFKKDKMVVNSRNAKYGESKEESDISFSGDEIELSFNPKFLLDTLNVLKEDFAYINIIDESKPCIITGGDKTSFVSAIMPMRTK